MLPEYIFIDDRVLNGVVTVTTGPMIAVSTPVVAVTYGDPIAVVNEWDCSRNGDESKQ